MKYFEQYKQDVQVVMSEFEPSTGVRRLAAGVFAAMVVHQARKHNLWVAPPPQTNPAEILPPTPEPPRTPELQTLVD
jgi:hypothetical protein